MSAPNPALGLRYFRRKAIERLAVGGMLLCAGITIFFLVTILGYVLYRGATAIDWEFMT